MQLLIHALTSTVVLSTVEVRAWMSDYIPLICMDAITYPSSNFADGSANVSKDNDIVLIVAQDPLDLGCDHSDSPVVKTTNLMLFYIKLFYIWYSRIAEEVFVTTFAAQMTLKINWYKGICDAIKQ